MIIQYLKAIHIISIVSWFAGLFFFGRMLIYHAQALTKPENEKNTLLDLLSGAEKRVLYIITLPALIITLITGYFLMMKTGAYKQIWFHLKLLLVLIFIFYNGYCIIERQKLLKETDKVSILKLRLMNETPLIFLVIIVFTVYLKNTFSGLWAGLCILIIGAIIGLSTYVYKIKQKK